MTSSTAVFDWVERSLRPDRKDPFLRIQNVMILVRDLDRSISFYVHQLGFSLIMDAHSADGARLVAVAPPDGTAFLSLRVPAPESEEYGQIGRSSRVLFITEDVNAKYQEWSSRGIRFRHGLQALGPGMAYADFEDIDGNPLRLAAVDDLTRGIQKMRQAMAEKAEAERRAAQELEIAKQVQSRLFPQTRPPLRTLD